MTNPETKAKRILAMARESAPRRGGRPRKTNSKNRGEMIKLRVSREEKDILSIACHLLSMTYTSLLLDYGVENAKVLLKAEGFKLPE